MNQHNRILLKKTGYKHPVMIGSQTPTNKTTLILLIGVTVIMLGCINFPFQLVKPNTTSLRFFTQKLQNTGVKFDKQKLEKIKRRLDQRRVNLSAACLKLNRTKSMPEDEQGIKRSLRNGLYFSDTNKMLFCLIPKCASYSIKRLILDAEGLLTHRERNIDIHLMANKMIVLRPRMEIAEIKKRLEYKKVLIIRDPVYRLLSAYRNKLYIPHREGVKYPALSRHIHSTASNDNKNVSATFHDFLSYVANDSNRMDEHWCFYYKRCSPCTISYDYIFDVTTIDDDMDYVTDELNITNVVYPRSNSTTTVTKIKSFFSGIPEKLLYDVYKRYKIDYDLFGYKFPPF